MLLTDIFPTATTDDPRRLKNLQGNTINCLVQDMPAEMLDDIKHELEDIKRQLRDRHMELGEFVGAGKLALVFNIKTDRGENIKSAVLRIESNGLAGNLNNPGGIDPVFQYDNRGFVVSIVPRADHPEKPFELEDVQKTLAVINAEGKLGRLRDLNGVISHQFMQLPGIDVPVLVDLNAAGGDETLTLGQGGVREFLERYKLNEEQIAEVMQAKVSPEELARLKEAQRALSEKIKQELMDKGLDITPVATHVDNPLLSDVFAEPVKGRRM